MIPRPAALPTDVPWKTSRRVGESSLRLLSAKANGAEFAATKIYPKRRGRPSSVEKVFVYDRKTSDLSWQHEIFAAYDQVGELRYTVNALARGASRAILQKDSSPRTGPEKPATSVASPSKPRNALPAQITMRAALLYQLVGEFYIVSRRNASLFELDVLSPVEVIWDANNGTARLPGAWGIYDSRGSGFQNIRLTRVHNPHPAYWTRSDCAPRTALPILRELIGLTMQISACIDSRLAGAGVFVYPMSAEVRAAPGDTATDDDEDLPLGDALMSSMMEPMENRDTASAHVPILLGLPDEALAKDATKHLTFATPLDEQAPVIREQCIRRLALALDAPAEVLLGMQNTTSHFATWATQDDTIRTHIEPLLEALVEGFGTHLDEVWTYDVSPLKRRPNVSAEAVQLFDRGQLSGEALRLANGFVESDAPVTAEEDLNKAAWEKLDALIQKSPSLAQTPGIPAVLAQIKAALRGDDPDNALYPGHDVAVSEAETPRAPDDEANGREEPRATPPAAAPSTEEPTSEGAPNRGARGRPVPQPGN